jgi:hypothetical protein
MYRKKKDIPKEISKYMADLGSRSKGGGRPRIPESELTDEQKKRRERYDKNLLDRILSKAD